MKIFTSALIALTCFSSALSNQIKATVVFDNFNQKTTISGVFYNTETSQAYKINSLDSFTVELPEEGKHYCSFGSDEAKVTTYYPVRIRKRKNTITMRLEDEKGAILLNQPELNFHLKDISNYMTEQVDKAIRLGTINFIIHGLMPSELQAVELFKTTYGIGFISENCVINPLAFKMTLHINKRIQDYLTSKYGNEWTKEIPATPFGLQLGRF